MNAGCEDDNDAAFDDDEELELFLKAYDEGQVRICCEWTAAPLATDDDRQEPYARKVAVWKRPWAAAADTTVEEMDMDDMDDDEDLTRALDEWEEESAVCEAVDRAIEEHYALEKTEEETPASPPPPPPPEEDETSSWKTPRNAILYTTRRWDVVPRASKRLEAKEHARWVAAAQQSIDAEDEWRRKSEELDVDEKLAELRRTSTPKRKKTKRKKMLTPHSKLLATGWERGTARRNLAKLDFK